MSGQTPDGLEQLRDSIARGKRPPIGEALQFELIEVDECRAVFSGEASNPAAAARGECRYGKAHRDQ